MTIIKVPPHQRDFSKARALVRGMSRAERAKVRKLADEIAEQEAAYLGSPQHAADVREMEKHVPLDKRSKSTIQPNDSRTRH